jgi:hypothetical protein
MLIDPLPLAELSMEDGSISTVSNGNLRVIDVSPGKSIRVCAVPASGGNPAFKVTLSISHSESKENKSQITDRTSVRLEYKTVLENGTDVFTQATLTVSTPRVGISPSFTQAAVTQLIGTLLADPATGDFSSETLTRVLTGEP